MELRESDSRGYARGKSVRLQGLYNGVPPRLKHPDTLAKFLVLALTGTLSGLLVLTLSESSDSHAGAERAVLGLELGDAVFESDELRLASVTAVLRCYPVTVCARFLALLRGEFSAGTFAWGSI